MGLSTGLKKLDLLLSFGVEGSACRLSMVRSESDGRDVFRAGADSGGTYSSISASSRVP